jgi:hypothetical protein
LGSARAGHAFHAARTVGRDQLPTRPRLIVPRNEGAFIESDNL